MRASLHTQPGGRHADAQPGDVIAFRAMGRDWPAAVVSVVPEGDGVRLALAMPVEFDAAVIQRHRASRLERTITGRVAPASRT